MKKHILTAVLAMVIAFSANAQHGPKKQHKPQFTPEQIVVLKLKKMTLALDLSEAQSNKLRPIFFEQVEKRKAMMEQRKNNKGQKPSKEVGFKKMNERLDEQIATKKKIKKILNKEQFERFEKMVAKKHHKKGKPQRGKLAKGKNKKGKQCTQECKA